MADSRLTSVINTLNQITVQGKDNMNRLLGCILVLESMNSAEEVPSDILPDPAEIEGA